MTWMENKVCTWYFAQTQRVHKGEQDSGLNILRLNENTHSYPFYTVSFIPELSVRIILRYFDSLAIRLWSKDLKHLIPRPGRPGLQG